MNNHQKFGKNVISLFVSQLISYSLIFFYTIYLARYLGAEGYGTISFALAFSGIFSIITDLGLNTLIVREVSRNRSLANKYLINVFLIKLVLALISFLLVILVVNVLSYPITTIFVVYFISLSLIITSIYGVFYSIFQSFEKMEYQSFGLVLSSVIIFVGVMIGVKIGFGVINFSIIFFISSLITLIYTFLMCVWKFFIPKQDYSANFLKEMMKEALPFGITGISVMLYINIDSVLLSIFQNNEVVGFYSAAYRLVLFLIIIPNTINIAIFPLMSKYHINSKSSLRIINEKYFKLMLVVGIPLGVGITLLADKIILFIYGIGYINSIIALQILIWTIVFTFASAASTKLLEATNKQLILTKISIISVIVNIILNLVLIPAYNYVGASIATVVTEIFLVGCILIVSNKLGYGVRIKKIVINISKIVFSSFIMGIILIYSKNVDLIIGVVSSIIIYFLVLIFIRGIDTDDIKLLRLILFNKLSK